MMTRGQIEEHLIATVVAMVFVAGLASMVVLLAEFVG